MPATAPLDSLTTELVGEEVAPFETVKHVVVVTTPPTPHEADNGVVAGVPTPEQIKPA